MDYRATLKSVRGEHRAVQAMTGNIAIRIYREQSVGWAILERIRRNDRIRKYPWSDGRVTAVTPGRRVQPKVIHRNRVTPAFRLISCETCENYGTEHCDRDLTRKPVQIQRESGEYLHLEVAHGRAAYTSIYMEDDGGEWIHRSQLQEAIESGVSLPNGLTRNEYDRYYNSPEYQEQLQAEAHCKPYRHKWNQSLVWIQSNDGQMYVIRQKDLAPNGGKSATLTAIR